MSKQPEIKRYVSDTSVVLYRIPCEVMPGLSARVYLLLGAGEPTLVDAGSGQRRSTEQILAGIEAVRSIFGEPIRVEDIRRILITHGHIDHVGGLSELRARSDAAVGIHELDSRMLTAHRERAAVGRRKLMNFFRQAGVEAELRDKLQRDYAAIGRPLPRVPVGVTLEDGATLDGLRFVHTPGHSPGHTCIVVGNILLSGDHVMSHQAPQQWPESINPYTGLGHYLDSLDKVGRLEGIDLVLAAHEAPFDDLPDRVGEIKRTQHRRLERVIALLSEHGPMTIAELARKMYPHAIDFHRVLALQDTAARVEYLHQRGRLVIANPDEGERDELPVYRYATT